MYHVNPEVLEKIIEDQVTHSSRQRGLEQVEIKWPHMCTLLQSHGSPQKQGQLKDLFIVKEKKVRFI